MGSLGGNWRFSEKLGGGGGTLSGPSQPAARHALSNVPTPTHADGPPGDGATSPGAGGGQPGLQVTRTEAVVPPTLVHQGEPAMASASAQHSELSRVTGSLVGGGWDWARKRQGDGLEPGLLSAPINPWQLS